MSLLVPAQTRGAASIRWDDARARLGDDAIALSVADMDFECPREVVDAVVARACVGGFPYTYLSDGFCETVSGWFGRRHGWDIDPDSVIPVGRVVEALPAVLRELTDPQAEIIVPMPAYGPIPAAVAAAGRRVASWPVLRSTRYEFDLTLLAELAGSAQALVLTNPHNPTGRVWSRAELAAVAEIAESAGLVVVSDEVHADLLLNGAEFAPYSTCTPRAGGHSISFTSPGKTFNIAGLETVNIIAPDAGLRERTVRAVTDAGCHNPRFFAEAATEAAYTMGEPWLDELLALVAEHVDIVSDHLRRYCVEVEMIPAEGTYLAWLDCRPLGLTDDELLSRLACHGLDLSAGRDFGAAGAGHLRMNLAVPTERLREALVRFTAATNEN